MLHPLPVTTFGEITALGLKATVCCSRCYEHRSIDSQRDGRQSAETLPLKSTLKPTSIVPRSARALHPPSSALCRMRTPL